MSKDEDEQEYCGCCGNEIIGFGPGWWCRRCMTHVEHGRRVPAWDRTFFAQHKRDCPYQVPTTDYARTPAGQPEGHRA